MVDYREVAGGVKFKELDGDDFDYGVCLFIFKSTRRSALEIAAESGELSGVSCGSGLGNSIGGIGNNNCLLFAAGSGRGMGATGTVTPSSTKQNELSMPRLESMPLIVQEPSKFRVKMKTVGEQEHTVGAATTMDAGVVSRSCDVDDNKSRANDLIAEMLLWVAMILLDGMVGMRSLQSEIL